MSDWWRHAVIYQIYPRSFQDDSGDGIGDLPGIIRRLDHVAELGADAVWLSPVFPSPMADMGYDVADYRGIDPVFGSLDDFDALVEHAHALGLRVIIDQVLSHSSSQHPWFLESRESRTNPRADWYVWADAKEDGSPPTNWLAVFGGPAWTWDPRRRQYYLHHFLVEQPDLNFHHPPVQDELLDVLRFWLDRGVDGFRLDVVNFYHHDHMLRDDPPDPDMIGVEWAKPYDAQLHLHSKTRPENIPFLRRMRELADSYGATLLGEVVEGPQRSVKLLGEYTRGTDRLHMGYSFDLLSAKYDAAHFRGAVGGFFEAAPDGWPCWAFSNHDVVRHATRWEGHGDVARQAAALLLSLPGSVCLYQGEELGQSQTELEFHEVTDPEGIEFWPVLKGRDGCRTPMVWDDTAHGGFTTGTPWLPVKAAQAARSVAAQEGQDGSVLEHYRAMLGFRRDTPALRSRGIWFPDAPEPVLAFLRGDLLCVFNLSAATCALRMEGAGPSVGPAAGRWAGEILELDENGYVFLRKSGDAVTVRFA